ncbi:MULTISPECIES: two-component system response regulator [unclassified Phenylobacterium]|uniref:response regulator n=1 Tax=unclassified Phenylobacterium TaxID=2640670 RepID=UPI000A709958|nr:MULTISPECIES: response regulator [unclassified Phenylobacterium]
MFTENLKQIQRMTPLMQRVLIIDPAPASARLLADSMRNIANVQLWHAPTTRKGLEAARQVNPQLIFVELAGTEVDGVQFSRQLRRSDAACRMAPIIMVTATATAAAILSARDAGVHEFLRKPYTTKDLLRRLEAVTLHPRDWVEAVEYVGPDRRRFNSGDYSGPLKRRSDATATPEAQRITQALKIVRSAIPAIATDPSQAMRALLAQMVELQRAAAVTKNAKLAAATVEFQRELAVAAQSGALVPEDLARKAADLLAFLPKDEPGRERAA